VCCGKFATLANRAHEHTRKRDLVGVSHRGDGIRMMYSGLPKPPYELEVAQTAYICPRSLVMLTTCV
jgi:hypothetical protein